MTQSHLVTFHAGALATLLVLGGCRARYLGSYDVPDGGDAGGAGTATSSTGSGGGSSATGGAAGTTTGGSGGAAGTTTGGSGAGMGGAGVGGEGGLMLDASSDAGADSNVPPEASPDANVDPADQATDGAADAPSEGAACTGISLPAPVANYTFDDCDDALPTLRDSSPRHADAVRKEGVRCSAGRAGLAVYFSGDDLTQNGYLTVPGPNAPQFTNALTLSAWFSVWEDRYANLIGKWFYDDSFLLLTNGLEFVYSVALPDGDGGLGIDYQARGSLTLYRWMHVVAVFDGASVALYIDGKLAQSTPIVPPGALQQTSRPLQMGGLGMTGSYFKGLIDEVRLYDVALDAGQVRALDCAL